MNESIQVNWIPTMDIYNSFATGKRSNVNDKWNINVSY